MRRIFADFIRVDPMNPPNPRSIFTVACSKKMQIDAV